MKRYWKRGFFTPYLFLLPQLALVGVFTLYPFFYNLVLSFQDESLYSFGFVGLDQYAQLWRDEIFWTALRNTFQYTVEMVFLTTALSLVAACRRRS
jgi:multiple sugar transport system permease protein